MRTDFASVEFDRSPAGVLERDAELWSLYESSFPADEREPRAVILGSVERGLGRVIRARRGGHTVGLATAHLLHDPAAVFLVYLAVSPECRGQGLGRALFEEVAREGSAGVVWEVDVPEKATSPDERARRERRLSFFRRLGGVVVLRTYVQPPVNGISEVPMYLMARSTPGGAIDVASLVRAVYFEKYADANGIARPVLERLLSHSLSAR